MEEVVLMDDGKDKITLGEVKEPRVILSLTRDQAQELSKYLNLSLSAAKVCDYHADYDLMGKISKRIDRTILKQKFLEKCKEDGIELSKENIKQFMEGIK
jgi:predicted HicB family RNase H-like nuclease